MGSLALSQADRVVYSHAFGNAQLAPAVPATPATRYRVDSVTKVLTAALIFQLIEEKKLTLATFFSQLPNAKSITIDQLLSHHSGLHSLTSDPAYRSYQAQPKTQAELLALIANTTPDLEPGTKAMEPVSPGVFTYDQAGIRVEFDAAKSGFTLQQGGRTVGFTKD